jgi:hypothetical protein
MTNATRSVAKAQPDYEHHLNFLKSFPPSGNPHSTQTSKEKQVIAICIVKQDEFHSHVLVEHHHNFLKSFPPPGNHRSTQTSKET